MLRAARFASQLGFAIDSEIEKQAHRKAAKILEVSKERWTAELDRLITSAQPEKGFAFLAQTRLLNYLLPELAVQVNFDQDSPYHELDLWQHTLKTVRLSPNTLVLRWAALLHDIGKPFAQVKNKKGYSNYANHEQIGAELARKIGSHLRWSNQRTREIAELVARHLESDSPLCDADSAARFKDY